MTSVNRRPGLVGSLIVVAALAASAFSALAAATNEPARPSTAGSVVATNATRPASLPADLGAVDTKTAAGVWEVLRRGRYAEATQLAEKGFKDSSREEEWGLVLAETHLAMGRYTNALEVVTNALTRSRTSVRLRLVGHEAALYSGKPDQAREFLDEIRMVLSGREWAYRDAVSLVALGRAAVLMGSDPRTVLTQLYDRAKTEDPNCRDAYAAAGELALAKGDYQLAAKSFGEGLKKFPRDPDLHGGLARAFAPSDTEQMVESVEAALELNPNHIPSLLLLADHMIDAEEYEEAESKLAQVLKVNPHRPEAWAYRAVIAHLQNDAAGEKRARDTALRTFRANPAVDHQIGESLSRKYRFAEGATYQRQALRFDPDYLSAKIQLAQDLLRLGQEDEGWRLAAEVQRRDNYQVEAFNLVTLQEALAKFQTLTNEHFVLRMGSNEARLYGSRALQLLERARTNLTARYGLQLERPVTVEVFPEQKDFAVRTFGLPHNPGFLGVCFGDVVTANSPASQGGNPANWEAVLWHEFVHVITLHLTRNKMPRWLSEGISVYEERQANPTWGQSLNPRFREMILEGQLKPIGRMSAAFLTSKTGLDMQFAYFQSALAVEFLVERFGLEKLRKILTDLGAGKEINAAIEANTAPLTEVDKDFAAFAKERARALAPGLNWDKPKITPDGELDLAWAAARPTNYYVLMQQAQRRVREKQWAEAKAPLKQLIDLYPDQTTEGNAYALLARVHRELKETAAEREVLTRWAARDADAVDAFLRLMELGAAEKDWRAVRLNAERHLAVNPLLPQPYRYLAEASEALGASEPAIQAYQKLLLLDPPDPAQTHYRLARLLHTARDPGAKREVLMALEEAPRFRDAQRLLLEIEAGSKTPPAR